MPATIDDTLLVEAALEAAKNARTAFRQALQEENRAKEVVVAARAALDAAIVKVEQTDRALTAVLAEVRSRETPRTARA